MQMLSLNGEWTLKQDGKKEKLTAQVPGCVHTDLLAADKIADPYYRDNEDDVQWISEAAWLYTKTFSVPDKMLNSERVLLRCDGLDTFAAITLNGRKLATTNNMYRTWEFNIKQYLNSDENTLEIRFDSPLPYIRQQQQEQPLPDWHGPREIAGRAYVRKEPCNFGWDWGPVLTTCGIWRNISIIGFSTARLADVHITQDHSKRNAVNLELAVEAETVNGADLSAAVTVNLEGETVAEATGELENSKGAISAKIKKPKLWWPNGLGEQPLYEVKVKLKDADGTVLDTATKKIGLRTLRLIRKPDDWGESFYFEVNGKPFFAKGANWIPADAFATRMTRDRYENLLQSTAEANMNMLRVWGGGIYEDDNFYELCDELGICIWQDFMFACSTYPTFDDTFMHNVKAEAIDNVRRLRHHPCIALWCGNNELEQGLVGDGWAEGHMSWEDYKKLFDKMLPEVVSDLDPQRDYWPSSPHSPCGDRADHRNPTCGDAHLWDVWHGRKPFEWYRTCTHRFNSEFGFQSFPEPKTVYGYTLPDDRNVTSRIMEHHQRSGIGNSTIITYMLSWFRLPTDFDKLLWLTQILQGMAIKYAVENWRRSMPRGMGTLYWQLNDCWPVASWASVDYFGRWKALHYLARNFYAPVLVSGIENTEKGTVEVHLTNDLPSTQEGEMRWKYTDTDGEVIVSGSKKTKISGGSSKKIQMLNLKKHLDKQGVYASMLWLEFVVDGEVVSSNFVSFARPKHLELQDPKLSTSVKALKDGSYEVTVKSRKVALWAWLEIDGKDAEFSDNFFHVLPDTPVRINVRPARKMTADQLRKKLQACSLYDTYQ